MRPEEVDWPDVMASVVRETREPLTPARRRALRSHANDQGLVESCGDRDELVEALVAAAPAVGSAVASVFAGRGLKPPTRRPYTTPTNLLTAEEGRRSTVVSEYFASEAARFEPVVRFREKYLRGRTLSPREGLLFVDCFAYRVLTPERLEASEIPTHGVHATKLRLAEPFEHLFTKRRTHVFVHRLGVRCEWGSGRGARSREEVVEVPGTQPRYDVRWEQRELRLPDGERIEFQFLPGSLLSKLDEAAESLRWQFYWRAHDATWFILTGKAPSTPVVHVDTSTRSSHDLEHGLLTLEIQPWASKDSVSKVFEHAQRHMLGKGGRHRALDSLERFAFAWRLRAEGATWEKIARRWDARPGRSKRAGRTNWRTLERDVQRVREELFKPLFAMGVKRALLERERKLMARIRLVARRQPKLVEQLLATRAALKKAR